MGFVMNYVKIYNDIILKSVMREPPDCYTEKHHVVPKCMGGDDSSDNMVILTAKEHYICHALLYKAFKTQKLAFSWRMMSTDPNGNRYKSRLYKYAREAWSRHMSEITRGIKRTDEARKKMSDAHIGCVPWNKGKTLPKRMSEQRKAYLANPKKCVMCDNIIEFNVRNRSRYCSYLCREKDRASWSVPATIPEQNSGWFFAGRKVPDDHAKKISKSLTGLKRPRGECPHCGKDGAISLLKRWHFNNCKKKGVGNVSDY